MKNYCKVEYITYGPVYNWFVVNYYNAADELVYGEEYEFADHLRMRLHMMNWTKEGLLPQ